MMVFSEKFGYAKIMKTPLYEAEKLVNKGITK